MKLSERGVDRTLDQFDAEPLPETHPAITQLNEVFGEHTFFLDDTGLVIVEPADGAEEAGQVVKLASWNPDHTSLKPHEPERTDVMIDLSEDRG
ncbi:MAG TPA: hypothetical protein VKB68_18810 [Stellaceae bacterium]|nr:hypothetical protein [Stellaceae bacterium]